MQDMLVKYVKNNKLRSELEYVFKHSLFLCNYYQSYPEKLESALTHLGKIRDKNEILKSLNINDFISMSKQEFDNYLRHSKMTEYLIITYNDLILKKPIEEITFHLSSFASAVLEIAYQYAYNKLSEIHGMPTDTEGNVVPFTIIGLGKLGGYELNFSSDIDIIYVYGSEKGKTSGEKPISNHEFFVKLGKEIFHHLSDRNEIGIVYRVDLRLRPDGEKGELALPLRSYEVYYEAYGQNWERMMLLKANPVAGDLELGNRFLEMVKPFVFRRSLDTKLINDLLDVKGKIQRRIDLKGRNEKNVKLGFGGIREIEFIIQALQILNYPKNQNIVERNSLKAIEKLASNNILSESDAKFLSEAYRFLRKLEHMAQVENEFQTHTVPENSKNFDLYLERCGFKTKEEFEKKYLEITTKVNKLFNSILQEAKTDETAILFDEELTEKDIALYLKSKNIANPEKCTKIIKNIITGSKYRKRQASELKIIKAIFKLLIPEISKFDNPDEILSYFEKLLLRKSSIYLIYDLILEYPQLIQKLITIFSLSKHLSEIIVNNPNTIEFLYDPMSPNIEMIKIYESLKEIISKPNIDEELEYELLRIKQKELLFNIGYLYLNKSINIVQTMYSLTNIARAFTLLAFENNFKKLISKYGYPITTDKKNSDYLILGLGKLGSFEISFGSDLDLIVLYEDNGYTDSKTNKITNQEFFSKLVQKVIHYLSTITYNGYLYKVDLRLRPSGSSGTLVTTLSSFDEYHKKSSMTWEKQALLRADVINNTSSLAEPFFKIKEKILFNSPITQDEIKEIYEMRFRIEKEKGSPITKNDFKSGYGGLIDIEFVAQALQLKYAHTSELLKGTNTHYILHFLKDLNILSSRNFYALHNSYLFLRNIENLTRVYNNLSTSKLPSDSTLLYKIATFFGYNKENFEKILSDFQSTRKTVRGAFNRIFEQLLSC
ncbi:bifunctional [glutamate--ammonia ligase]-adenylyl-L-tyrosine phosphorylase/[glutamate--ammonia-ligase] adenylyltransferase [Deferribacter thermophilus]|uniref:bifunctional [glutamate--ammonia ligase]-adenylyl-L-tyrosine phosphorylase/[glutamate--ammonia-ligase] adenylyltransferase n=1 Tax=Deferribacter thermophilus TaxID=53573 RepID=UPI003C2B20EE